MVFDGKFHGFVGLFVFFKELLKEERLLRNISEQGKSGICSIYIGNEVLVLEIFKKPETKYLEFGELTRENGLLLTNRLGVLNNTCRKDRSSNSGCGHT